MKLNTLLLASAATLIASSAFAADLPSKKAAPAAGSVQVCKVGGMTGFTLPGSDTCLGISGFVRFDAQYNLDSSSDDGFLDWSPWTGRARVNFDARSNSEVGVVRSFTSIDATYPDSFGIEKAYVQFAGVTAGKKSSIADVLGTQSDAMTLASNGSTGIDYQVKVGDLNFGIGAEAPVNNNLGPASSDNPDLVAHLSGNVGTVGFAVAAVSHTALDGDSDSVGGELDTTNGYAVKGNVNVTMNGLRLGVFGGMATNAAAYIGGYEAGSTGLYDYTFGDDLESSMYGVSALYSADKLSIGAEWAHYEHDQDVGPELNISGNEYAIFAGYKVAKGLTVYTEYHSIDIDSTDDGEAADESKTNTILFRIQRDF